MDCSVCEQHRRADRRPSLQHAAEARAKIVYKRLINLTDDPGVKEALGFLMTREIAHQKSFEKALYANKPNFPAGKLPGDPRFTSVYFNLSQVDGDAAVGPWNSGERWEARPAFDEQVALDGGDGRAMVSLSAEEPAVVEQMATRSASDPSGDPMTGAELVTLHWLKRCVQVAVRHPPHVDFEDCGSFLPEHENHSDVALPQAPRSFALPYF